MDVLHSFVTPVNPINLIRWAYKPGDLDRSLRLGETERERESERASERASERERQTDRQTDRHFGFDALRSLCYSDHSPAVA